MTVEYYCWCENEDCDWDREGECRTLRLAQKETSGKMVGHGLKTGHHQTYRDIDE